MPVLLQAGTLRRHLSSLSSVPMEEKATPGATEGDVVEGMYNCKFNEWYRGTITRVRAAGETVDVRYDDGEDDPDLFLGCVRRFRPYELNESVQFRVDEETFEWGTIAKVNADGTFNVRTEDYTYYRNLGTKDLRRKYALAVGSRIEADYASEGTWYPGTIMKANPDGTYDVAYDDGDFEANVGADRVQSA